MGDLKKPLSLNGFNHSSFEPIHFGWLNIPYILTSWRLGVFSWCKKHPSTWFFCFLAGEDFNFLSELFG